ncbi:MAG: hypothetical protein LLG01_00930 [Planctomycetaceae bacterium]|nr:hypothetical protein [Planctomycetaceae bacterium]
MRKLRTEIRVSLVVMIALWFVVGWSYTYDTTTPDGATQPVSVLDDHIRLVKQGIQERENVDHYWPFTGTQVSDTAVGEHRKVQFYGVLASKPTLAAGEGALYIKTVSGVSELFYEDSAAVEKQLTTAGKLNLVSGDITTALNFAAGLTVGADTDIGNYDLHAKSFTSDVAIGTAPLTVTSTTKVANLNADQWDGYEAGAMLGAKTSTDTGGSALASGSTYQAQTDGNLWIVEQILNGGAVVLATDASNPSTTTYTDTMSGAAITQTKVYSIKKSDYVKVSVASATATLSWQPIGSGGLVKQP